MKGPMSSLHLPLSPAINRGVLFALLALSAPGIQAQNFERGQKLFENHCQACHTDMHRPESRHLHSLAELRKRIDAWALHTNTGWQKDDVDDVLFYLNQSFYKFPEKPL
jgi:mono/diheme cytochrome c family protein